MTNSPFGTPGASPFGGTTPEPQPAPASGEAQPAEQGRNTVLIAGIAGAVVLAAAAGAGAFFLLGGDDAVDAPVAAPPAAPAPADSAADEAPLVQAPVMTSFNARNPWIQAEDPAKAAAGAGAPAASPVALPGSSLYAPSSGYSGTSGTSTVGPSGLPGKDGVNGSDGVNGLDGVNGKDGAPGKDGVNGKDGAPGKDGTPGQDGKSVDVVQVTVDSITPPADATTPTKGVFTVTVFGSAPSPAGPVEAAVGSAVFGLDKSAIVFDAWNDTNSDAQWQADELTFTVGGQSYSALTSDGKTFTFFVPAG